MCGRFVGPECRCSDMNGTGVGRAGDVSIKTCRRAGRQRSYRAGPTAHRRRDRAGHRRSAVGTYPSGQLIRQRLAFANSAGVTPVEVVSAKRARHRLPRLMNRAIPAVMGLSATWNLAVGEGLPSREEIRVSTVVLEKKWPVLIRHEQAASWPQVWADLGRAPRTIDAYTR